MDAVTEAIINTSLLYITTHFGVNGVTFPKETPNFKLPIYKQDSWENQLVLQVMKKATAPSIYIVQDTLFAEYCLAFIEDYVVFIGPYRTRRLYQSQLSDDLIPGVAEKEKYLATYKTYPLISTDDLQLGIHIMWTSLYGTLSNYPYSILDMRKLKTDVFSATEAVAMEMVGHDSAKDKDLSFTMMAYVQQGNHSGAIRTYREIMHNRAETFVLINTIEGLTNIRILLSVAMHNVGIPTTVIESELNSLKIKGRYVTNISEAKAIAEQMIYSSCALVCKHTAGRYSPVIQIAMDYIHRNLSEEINLSQIAAEVSLTPNSLTSKFHNEVGMPPLTYITRCRMEQAANLLRNTQTSIQDISASIGIIDANYFARCFKKYSGMSPSEYRRKNRQSNE